MPWAQQFTPAGSLWLSALAAAVPLIILFYMLAVRQAKGHIAAAFGLAGALLVAFFVWGMPAQLAVNAVFHGADLGPFPTVWIVIKAIWGSNMKVESGEF